MPIEPWEETRPVANRRDAGLYGSRDGTVVERGDAGSAIAARMGTGEAHGDALARLVRVLIAFCWRHAVGPFYGLAAGRPCH